jgi:hypothetical protein
MDDGVPPPLMVLRRRIMEPEVMTMTLGERD